jgi:hypothetical protein
MAASAIQSDPSQAQIPPGDFDPLIIEAINAGAADAAALTAAQTTLAPRAVKHHCVSRGLDRMVRAGLACKYLGRRLPSSGGPSPSRLLACTGVEERSLPEEGYDADGGNASGAGGSGRRTGDRRLTSRAYLWGRWKHHTLPNVCPKDLWQLSEGARRLCAEN